MYNQKTTRQPNGWRLNRVALAVAVALGGVAAMPGQAFAAAPAANTPIGNVATASYVDSASITRNATSNTVTTIVQQVASFVLTQDNTRQVTAGTQVVYPHSLANTGNGTDTFTLTIAQSAGDQFDLTGFHLYADTNNDGVPDGAPLDNASGVATVTVAAGDTFNFVLVGTTPTGYNAGDKAIATVVADTTFDTVTATQTNTDTATLTTNAVINVVKSANKSIGPNGTTITYTLRYTNTGNKTATNVNISDVIQAGLVYQTGTGKWNGTTKTDGTGDDEYAYNGTTKTVSVVIPSVAPNTTGEITFDVVVNSAPGVLNNTGAFNYDPDGAGAAAQTSDTLTNTVPFTVQQTANVAANASDTINAKNGGADGDTVNGGTVTQGATVTFVNRIWNNSNGTDSFNIGLSGSTFPAGTTFQLYKSDGTNVLVDTNGDGIVDTGPVAAGAKYDVIVKAILPAGASGNNGGAGFSVTKTATSTASGAIIVTAGDNTDTVVDKIDAITANTVDITNNAAAGNVGALGEGAGTATAVSTNSVNPGVTTTFQLYVKNTSTVSDNFNLTASNVPAGWTVDFQSGTCGSTTSTIANTGTLAAGASVAVCAVVNVPSTAAPSTNNITFTSASPNSGASDYKVDAVTVNTVHQLQLVADRNGTVSPGGSISYSHTITNLGNVTEASISLASADSASGFSTAYYTDVNGNGVIDGGDTPITSALSLAAGNSVKIIAQVTSPSNAADGTVDSTTVSATASSITVTNTDTTRVSTAQVRLVKSQAYDAGCDGTADGAFTTTNISAKPNECIIYQVVATNEGSTAATTVVISDTTPAYTTMASTALAPTVTVGSIRAGSPANGATGTLYADVGTLGAQGGATPNSATLTFEVRIDH